VRLHAPARGALAALLVGALAWALRLPDARAAAVEEGDAPDARVVRITADRVAVRYYAPETGGSARPRFITERTLALEARLEALSDQAAVGAVYPDRYVRAALERHVAEDLLAALMVEAGTEPPDLPRQAEDARAGLIERVGGAAVLDAALAAEGLTPAELEAILRRRVRAAFYVDQRLSPILHSSDEQLREVYRTSAHPFKSLKFEEAREPLARWFVAERLRVAENAFLQAARARVKIMIVPK
jgi:hypothetical protein